MVAPKENEEKEEDGIPGQEVTTLKVVTNILEMTKKPPVNPKPA